MEKIAFRHPKGMTKDERTPISARVRLETKKALERAAKKHGLSIGLLVANVLDDYAVWLEKNPSNR